jgi:hypothetical protein
MARARTTLTIGQFSGPKRLVGEVSPKLFDRVGETTQRHCDRIQCIVDIDGLA